MSLDIERLDRALTNPDGFYQRDPENGRVFMNSPLGKMYLTKKDLERIFAVPKPRKKRLEEMNLEELQAGMVKAEEWLASAERVAHEAWLKRQSYLDRDKCPPKSKSYVSDDVDFATNTVAKYKRLIKQLEQ
jgi:hypothetical protein